MKLFRSYNSNWITLAPFAILWIAGLACASFIPSPVQTLPAPTIEIPVLPTVDPSIGSSEEEPTPDLLPTLALDPSSTDESSPVEPTLPSNIGIPSDLGQDIPIAGANHIDEDATATDWNSDPPTSGQHYGNWAPAGFYDDVIPDGYLVHDMEHGYVIIYYNCEMADLECETFKTAIETAIAAAGNDPNTDTVKVIAVPRPGMENPITYASWGHLYKAETFSPEELVLYVQTYRSNPDYAPEWSLP